MKKFIKAASTTTLATIIGMSTINPTNVLASSQNATDSVLDSQPLVTPFHSYYEGISEYPELAIPNLSEALQNTYEVFPESTKDLEGGQVTHQGQGHLFQPLGIYNDSIDTQGEVWSLVDSISDSYKFIAGYISPDGKFYDFYSDISPRSIFLEEYIREAKNEFRKVLSDILSIEFSSGEGHVPENQYYGTLLFDWGEFTPVNGQLDMYYKKVEETFSLNGASNFGFPVMLLPEVEVGIPSSEINVFTSSVGLDTNHFDYGYNETLSSVFGYEIILPRDDLSTSYQYNYNGGSVDFTLYQLVMEYSFEPNDAVKRSASSLKRSLDSKGLGTSTLKWEGAFQSPVVYEAGLFAVEKEQEQNLLEPSSINDFTDSGWNRNENKLNISFSSETTPDGELAQKLTQTEVNGSVQQYVNIASEGKKYTFGVWLKADEPHQAQIKIQNRHNTESTGLKVDVTTEWQYFSVTSDQPFSTNDGITAVIWPSVYNGTTDSVYASKAKLIEE
ncbi:carbohydrate binding domain-containing protein [Bacillus spongiae]|uniref:Carbohydrate binding domain-containing protein n=1 Tax=Bacillus spongiae TaxID=2683610 RepID=A0ABU8H8J7_9BACI